MTVTTTLDRQSFGGDGSNKNFPFNFKFSNNSQIIVYLISDGGTAIGQTQNSDYTISGANSSSGGQIVFTVAPPAGTDNVLITRVLPLTQPTSIRNQGAFFPAIHEDAFDRLTMLIQQASGAAYRALQRDLSGRYWDFMNIQAINLADPTRPQDATNMRWVQQYIGGLIGTGQGPVNSAANVLYVDPTGTTRTVQDLSGPNGAQYIGGASATVQSLAGLVTASQVSGRSVFVNSHLTGTGKGGGIFVWNGARARSKHNGGTIISPTVPPYTSEDGLSAYISATGETSPAAFGCFERVIVNNTLSIYDFGAISTYADCTAPIQKALSETRSNNGYGSNIGAVVIFPPEQFMFGGSITIGSSQSIIMYPKTVLLQIAGTITGVNQPLISISNQSDVSIYAPGATVKGVKYEATTGEGRAAVSIYASARVAIHGLRALTVSGDGFTISGNASDGSPPSSDVTLTECFTDSAGRNGFSVINVRRCALVRCGATLTAANGLGASAGGPWAGFDIENNPDATNVLEGISLTDCWSKNNDGNGLQFTLPYSSTPMSINVTNFRSELDGSKVQYGALCGGVGFIYGGSSTLTSNNSGEITLRNISIVKPFGSGIRFHNWSAKNAFISIDRVTIDQPAFGGGTGNINKCGLWIDSSAAADVAEQKGNFEINSLSVNDPAGAMVRAVWAMGTASAPVIANIKDGFVSRHGWPSTALMRTKVQGGVTYSSPRFTTVTSATSISAMEYLGQNLELAGAGGVLLPEAALCSGCSISLRNVGSGSVAVTTEGGDFTVSSFATYTNTGTTLTLTAGQRAVITSNGAAWVLD